MKEIEKISNQLFELREWLSEQPGHPSHLSNLPQWFWENWGECIDDLKRISKNKDGIETLPNVDKTKIMKLKEGVD